MSNFVKYLSNWHKYSLIGIKARKMAVRVLTPKWFTFLGWLFLLGTLNYIYKITNSKTILSLLIISGILIYFRFADSMDSISKFILRELKHQGDNLKNLIISLILSLLEFIIPLIILYFSIIFFSDIIQQITLSLKK